MLGRVQPVGPHQVYGPGAHEAQAPIRAAAGQHLHQVGVVLHIGEKPGPPGLVLLPGAVLFVEKSGASRDCPRPGRQAAERNG